MMLDAGACMRPLCFVIGAGLFPRPAILATGIVDDSEKDSIEHINSPLLQKSVFFQKKNWLGV